MQRPLDSGDENKGPEEGGPQQGKGNPEMDKMKKALEGSSVNIAMLDIECRRYN